MMGLCCCTLPKRKLVKDTSTQTDTLPLITSDNSRPLSSSENEAKYRSSLETALRLVQQAVDEDRAKNYEEALSLYQHALVYFLESLNYETVSENIKEKILAKCKQYLERAEKLAEHLSTHSELKKKRSTALSDVSKSVSVWLDSDKNQEQEPAPKNAVSRMYRSIIRKTRDTRSSVSSNQNTSNNFDLLPRTYSTR